MAVIINKSNHPVEVKKVPLLAWPLRAEIEEAIAKALEEKKDIEVIKNFYNPNTKTSQEAAPENKEETEEKAQEEVSNEMADETTEDLPTLQRQAPASSHHGELILADINMESVMFFCETPLKIGQTIGLELDIPTKFILSAQITRTAQINRNSKLIKVKDFGHRITASFLFSFKDEEDNLRTFLKSVEPVIPPKLQSLKAPQADNDSDDDFEDLGF